MRRLIPKPLWTSPPDVPPLRRVFFPSSACVYAAEKQIDPEVTATHEGKTYGFCCSDGVEEFRADPASFLTAKAAVKTDGGHDHAGHDHSGHQH